jgi:NAD(P)-dependent dehydrogenase (short-subunit alcohol dehydrogenase family)
MAKRTALVTGGNRGIGLEICRGLAAQGLAVVLGARDEADGRRAEAELGAQGLDVACYPLDVSDAKAIEHCRTLLERDRIEIDVLINNAGVYPSGDAASVDPSALDEAWKINLRGPFLICAAFVHGMRSRGYGRIVNVSSGSGSFAEGLDSDHAAYAITKAGLNALTVCLARTLSGDIKVNAMCPGWVRTRMGGAAAPRTAKQGADTAIWLATLPSDGPTGGFFRDRQPIEW